MTDGLDRPQGEEEKGRHTFWRNDAATIYGGWRGGGKGKVDAWSSVGRLEARVGRVVMGKVWQHFFLVSAHLIAAVPSSRRRGRRGHRCRRVHLPLLVEALHEHCPGGDLPTPPEVAGSGHLCHCQNVTCGDTMTRNCLSSSRTCGRTTYLQ